MRFLAAGVIPNSFSTTKYLVVLKELGMTPAARKRIEVEVEMDDELEQLLTFKDA